jgi:DNA polymerase III alpha subunit
MIDNLIDGTNALADRCHIKITLWQTLFPEYDTPDHMKDLYQKHQDNMIEDS